MIMIMIIIIINKVYYNQVIINKVNNHLIININS